ncbi:necrosis-inducing protein [Sinorhizobium meliloti]|uniref:Necrosis-inducing protein n=3 Tax=Rhizobium meliloti TaxID=382 RepID=A0AAW9TQU0_RHIML|nr:NPP1 family protein [Sinorhizobium meliloti]MQW34931.1 necrosis-inducing protein [Sinorhizobium meliloti]MQW35016.1 necrosis-inducing protein [Sinorhizobium meliloti]RVL87445.1 necrosis-inducing protein [Sinorhizobium meliloti]
MIRKKSAEAALATPLHQRLLIAAVMFVLPCGVTEPAHAGKVIRHDEVRGFPDGTSGLLKAFQPSLTVIRGCVPFPAVDADGNVSGGLKPSGMASGGCSRSPGQIYVRAGEYNGQCAVMYSWFFPKDQNQTWPLKGGSRYDWEDVIVWLTRCDSEAQVEAVSYWSGGRYHVTPQPHMDGTHPLVKYYRPEGGNQFLLADTRYRGRKQPAVSWSDLTEEARETLDNYNFGKVAVPFNSYNFDANLETAWRQGHGG